MSGSGVFDPKAFLQARSQGRPPPPPPPAPASPQILGVDSDDDFSNLNSSFATFGDVPSLSPEIGNHAVSVSPERSSPRRTSPESKPSPIRKQLSPVPDDRQLQGPTSVALPPGHSGHHTPDEVVQNQLFTGYGVPQRVPTSFGRRMGPSAVRRQPSAVRHPPSVPRSTTPNAIQGAPGGNHIQGPVGHPSWTASVPHNAPVPTGQPRAVRPPPRPPIAPSPGPQPEANKDPGFVHRGAVRLPPRPAVAPSPIPLPQTNADPGFVHRGAARPIPRPMPQPAARQPVAPTRMLQQPMRSRPELVRPALQRPPVMPRPISQPPLTAAAHSDRQSIGIDSAASALYRGGIPIDRRAPPPVPRYQSDQPRRSVPPHFRPRNALTPSRPPPIPSQDVQPPPPPPQQQQQETLDVVDNQQTRHDQSDSHPDESFDQCRSPSPLLLPPQRRSHGMPPVYRRIAGPPSGPAHSPSIVLVQSQSDQSLPKQQDRSLSPLSVQNTATSSPRPVSSQPPSFADNNQRGQSPHNQHSVSSKHQIPRSDPADNDNSFPIFNYENVSSPQVSPTRSDLPHSSPAHQGQGSQSSSRSVSPSPSSAVSPRAAVIETPNVRPDQQTRSRFRSPEPESAERNRDKSVEAHPARFERASHRVSSPGSIAGSISDERRQYFIQKAKLVQQRYQEETDSLQQQIRKLKASLRALPAPETNTVSESTFNYDDCLPFAFGENSRLVRRAIDEQLDKNARMEAMLSKLAFVLEAGSYPDSFQTRIEKSLESREMKIIQERLMSAEDRIKELTNENEYLSKQLSAKEERIRAVQEESKVLIETLRQSLEQETFERKRMNALYDEERHVLNASLRETIQKLAADNERYRIRLLEAGLSDD